MLMKFSRLPVIVMSLLLSAAAGLPAAALEPWERREYQELRQRLVRGWGTWDSRNVLARVWLPECISLNVAFKQFNWLGDAYLRRALIGRKGEGVERVKPGLHALDGSYSHLELEWSRMRASVETASDGDDLVMLVTPLEPPVPPVRMIVEAGMLWNRPGSTVRDGSVLRVAAKDRTVSIHTTRDAVEDPYVDARSPYLVLPLDGPVGVSTGSPRTLEQIRDALQRQRSRMETRATSAGSLGETYLAVESGIAWNTIYEPQHDRIVSTVGRLWNEEYGGYCLFGWDNFFLAYMTALYDRDLALANLIEHLRSRTDEGFIPNDDRGNGTKSWDHSQPPVGGIMLLEIYRKHPEQWLLEASFDTLLAWNRWWPKARSNEGLLSYGSHPAFNPYGQKSVHTKTTAGYESGMDDSPMYIDIPFNSEKNTLELQDVGLNSLYIADCRALAEVARRIGRREEATELERRAQELTKKMETLWDEKTGLFLNRRTDTGELQYRIAPTMFYPLLARMVDRKRAVRMVSEHFMNDAEFHGEYMLPSIARNDPTFPRQKYWKGAVWPPLNFLVYLGLRNYGFPKERRELVESSSRMFLRGWKTRGMVSENFSAITGMGDDERLSSDQFHSWGALMGFLSIIEEGLMPPPEAALPAVRPRR